MTQKRFLAYISLLAVLTYLSSDMYLPAFPMLETALHTQKSWIALTMSIYMIGIALGQLFYGPLSDRIGRKRTILLGTGLYCLASLGCALSPNIASLLIFRLLQALGACASLVIWQAIVIDRCDKPTSLHIFGLVYPILGLSPALAPVIGGVITNTLGWEAVFYGLTGFGIALFLLTALGFKETTETENIKTSATNSFSTIINNYKTLLRSQFFLYAMLVLSLSTTCYFVYLTESPFLLAQLGFTPPEIGLFFIPQTLAFMAGGLSCKTLGKYFNERQIIKTTVWLSFFGNVVLMIATIGFPLQYASQFVIPFLIMAYGNGVLFPTIMSKALHTFSHIAGTASGLSGFLQGFVIFIGVSVLSATNYLGVIAMSGIIFALSVGVLISFYWGLRGGASLENITAK